MIKVNFSKPEIEQLKYERYHHPHPRVQRKMEALLLKSQGLAHKDIASLTGVCLYCAQSQFEVLNREN